MEQNGNGIGWKCYWIKKEYDGNGIKWKWDRMVMVLDKQG